ncbi:MAG: ABC transporter permease [Prevotella sp.]
MGKRYNIIRTINKVLRSICDELAYNLNRMFHDQALLTFAIIVPLLYPLIYSWIYTNEFVRDIPLAVVDMSHSQTSREFLRRLDATQEVKIAYYCGNMEEARELSGKQKTRGIIYIPADFDIKINRGEQTQVSVYCDMALMLTYKNILLASQSVALDMGKDMMIHSSGAMTAHDEEVTTTPVVIDEVQLFNPTGGYGNSLIPAVLVIIIQQTLLLGIGLTSGSDRDRQRMGNIGIQDGRHVFCRFIGKAAAFIMLFIPLSMYICMAVPQVFSFTAIAQHSDLMFLIIPYVMACTMFSMTISFFVSTRESVLLVVVFTSVPFLFLTGISWPESNIPAFWKGISYFIPSTFGVRAYLSLSSMGASTNEILPEIRILCIQTLAYSITAFLSMKYYLGNKR